MKPDDSRPGLSMVSGGGEATAGRGTLRLVPAAPPPCLPGCEYATRRAHDLSDPMNSGHTCVVTLAEVTTLGDRLVVVQAIRWADATGISEPGFVEIRADSGAGIDEEGFSPVAAAELGAAFAAGATLIRDFDRPAEAADTP
ncbi:hypothetical protein V5P93_005976 [Actinokineospora auranticolor]|uniref:Uncharacterized protein n=1 Tax=Actinokineospora auranticolor TaxID=155976 RepID=A0A2S6GHG0_9PSEU|nr:hypothetical protein [Actinokineospora auranticolor]PPK64633.1 hypothetical protein CLV40_11823 [Actinokineospora auranticolor]